MLRCELCNSGDLVRARIKGTDTYIGLCRECTSVYEVDENLNLVFGHDPYDIPYFDALENLFEDLNDLTEFVPYNKRRSNV